MSVELEEFGVVWYFFWAGRDAADITGLAATSREVNFVSREIGKVGRSLSYQGVTLIMELRKEKTSKGDLADVEDNIQY
ncbi:hypothetical protein PABG_11911 [Paracoccidioides brasiliensis Pb03]|uniref:Uncharacterized protein n=1 Tax=Paracoccidioides brasiliensis TaxID=121759 RepID=A0A1D2J7A9_PARBR|nr:hypothetical protein PABG_11911 [Paracoccidioides brasiliensis Pb03]ODH14292.1 hypothetical protein ACO22_06609 [Paracoccidioides brasiliensis]ODH47239.1 hypothetical protein GX48_06641 [Paracoccidioides brasiliensis]